MMVRTHLLDVVVLDAVPGSGRRQVPESSEHEIGLKLAMNGGGRSHTNNAKAPQSTNSAAGEVGITT